jgi:hypothetical protein
VTRPFHHDAPDRLQNRQGGGAMAVFGIPFFAAGMFMILAVAGVIPFSNGSDMPSWGWFALACMALVFTGFGGGCESLRDRSRPTSSFRCRGFDNRSSRSCHTCRCRAFTSRAGGRARRRSRGAPVDAVLRASIGADGPQWLSPSRRGGTIVHVSSKGIEIQERGAWRTRRTALIEAGDLFEIDFSTRESSSAAARTAPEHQWMESSGATSATVGPRTERVLAWLTQLSPGHELTVKTRTGLISFGAGLDDDEIRYLHDVVGRGPHR